MYCRGQKCPTRKKAQIIPHSFTETEKKSYFVSQLRLHIKEVKEKTKGSAALYTHTHTHIYNIQTGSLTDKVGENRCGQVQ